MNVKVVATGTQLFVSTAFGTAEEDFVVQAFRDQYWRRRKTALGEQLKWVFHAILIPPLLLLGAGFLMRWVARGFRKP
jgi:hypothetical protein